MRLYFAELGITLLTNEIANHEATRDELQRAAGDREETRGALARTRDQLVGERAAAGGDRLGELERIADDARREAQTRRERQNRFAGQVALAGLEPVEDVASFAVLPARAAAERARPEDSRRRLVEQISTLLGRRNHQQQGSTEIRAELESLARRRNNLPLSHLDIRAQVAAAPGRADHCQPRRRRCPVQRPRPRRDPHRHPSPTPAIHPGHR